MAVQPLAVKHSSHTDVIKAPIPQEPARLTTAATTVAIMSEYKNCCGQLINRQDSGKLTKRTF